jgi:4-diphosphocytidyl-2-C-methyl-D-erythritol kinase
MATDRSDRPMTDSGTGRDGGGEAGAATIEMTAPAKLTLSLRVTGVRPDGYHEIESEMVTLDLADTLVIGPGDGLTIDYAASAVRGMGADVPDLGTGADNLVVRALKAVGRTAGVRLTKRIPLGAGLGGGSANAAAILRWAGCTDLGVAAELGADVPFCVIGGRARVRGIGESVTAMAYEAKEFTLLLPPFGVDTGAVYRTWDSLAASGAGPEEPSGNDLEAPAMVVEPRLALWREALAAATGAAPRLAGSGSTWFVEGRPEAFGLQGRLSLQVGSASGRLLGARTAPAG